MAIDNFTNTDGTNLVNHTTSTTWTQVTGLSENTKIYSNALRQTAYRTNCGFRSTSTADSSQVSVLASTSNNLYCGPAVRVQSASRGYTAELGTHDAGYYTKVMLSKDGSWRKSETVSYDETVSHTVKITASGTDPVTIDVYVDDTLELTYEDSSSPYASGYSGLFCSNNTASAAAMLDDWTDGLGSPSISPSASPSEGESSSLSPSQSPSNSPSVSPSVSSSNSPSLSPSSSPSNSPSTSPSASLSPSNSPSKSPSLSPSRSPSDSPSASPSEAVGVKFLIHSGMTGNMNG